MMSSEPPQLNNNNNNNSTIAQSPGTAEAWAVDDEEIGRI